MIQDLVSPIRIRNLIQGKREDSLLSYIDLWAIQENTAFGVSGSALAGFALKGRNILLKTPSEIDSFYQGIGHLLDSLPHRGRLDLQISYEVNPGSEEVLHSHRQIFGSKDPLARKMLEERTGALERAGIRHTEIYLFAAIHPSRKKGTGLSFGFERKGPVHEELQREHEARVRELSEIEQILSLSFQAVGIQGRRLTGEEIALYFYRSLNSHPGARRRKPRQGKGRALFAFRGPDRPLAAPFFKGLVRRGVPRLGRAPPRRRESPRKAGERGRMVL